jgi:trk system potassium uptake protein TrkA
MRKVIAVIGLGRFGLGLARALSNKDVDVIAIDREKANVAKVGDIIQNAVVCDSTNPEALIEAGVEGADNAIIAFGQDNQANIANTILTAVALKKIGVKKITCRIDDVSYTEMLERLGVDNVISPFDVASQSLAMKLSSDNVMDYYNVTEGFNVFQLKIPVDTVPIALTELNSPANFGVNIILVTRDGKTFPPTRDYIIKPNDRIFAFGEEKGVYKLENFLTDHTPDEK